MDIVIIKYNAGNIQSVLYALERIGVQAKVSDDPLEIRHADKVIFPGVGEASTAMNYLKSRGLDKVILDLKQPVLGICLGMQLMCSYSEENDTECLGIFQEPVRLFRPQKVVGPNPETETPTEHFFGSNDALQPGTGEATEFKVPQIGWNTIFDLKTKLFEGIPENSYVYFVHGYYAACGDHTIATAHYIENYSAALHAGNFYGVQFHPEKSAGIGEQILKNFIEKM